MTEPISKSELRCIYCGGVNSVPSPPVGEAGKVVERLRDARFQPIYYDIFEEAAALIEQLQSALRPFAELEIDATRIKLIEDKHIRRARALIGGETK